MAMIKGITVVLMDKVEDGKDEFNRTIYKEIPVEVDNVLVAPASTTDITDTLNLTGKVAVYTLAIPKGDTHIWEDRKVQFFGETWHTLGFAIQGIDSLIPLDWNRKVTVERYG